MRKDAGKPLVPRGEPTEKDFTWLSRDEGISSVSEAGQEGTIERSHPSHRCQRRQ